MKSEEQKSVIITGAASGIGRAAVMKFLTKGFYVFGIDLNEEGLNNIKTEVRDNFDYFVADAADEQQITKALEKFSEKTSGTLNVLCSNAGILIQKEFEEGNLKDYKKMLEVNSFGMVNLAYQALPMLKAASLKWGSASIVFTSSSSAEFGMPLFSVYSSTKGFIRNLTEALSAELKQYNIKVNDVMPLFVLTGMTKDQNEERFKKSSTQTPAQIAKVIYKASRGNKRHYRVGFMLHLLHFVNKFFPLCITQGVISGNLKVKYTQSRKPQPQEFREEEIKADINEPEIKEAREE